MNNLQVLEGASADCGGSIEIEDEEAVVFWSTI
jgi:hypothetical protein